LPTISQSSATADSDANNRPEVKKTLLCLPLPPPEAAPASTIHRTTYRTAAVKGRSRDRLPGSSDVRPGHGLQSHAPDPLSSAAITRPRASPSAKQNLRLLGAPQGRGWPGSRPEAGSKRSATSHPARRRFILPGMDGVDERKTIEHVLISHCDRKAEVAAGPDGSMAEADRAGRDQGAANTSAGRSTRPSLARHSSALPGRPEAS
jgi:hypothetical protein